MGRLEKHRQKQYTITITSIIVVIIIFVVFFFTVGIKLLLNASAFIASIGTEQTSTQPLEKNDNFVGSINIDSIPSATNSAMMTVEGSVLNFDKVNFYVNGTLVKEVSLTNSDEFVEEVGDLKKGTNSFYALALSSSSKETKKTQEYSVYYKSDKPKLEISEPEDGTKVSKQELKIVGLTDKEVFVRINDLPIVVDVQGKFQSTVSLKEGSNVIVITAQDIAGNTETKSVTVQYAKDE